MQGRPARATGRKCLERGIRTGWALALSFLGQTAAATGPAPDLETLAGRMLLMGFVGAAPEQPWPQTLARQVHAGQVGGVIMLGHNFQSREGVLGLTRLFREAAGNRPVWLMVDQEGGVVQRLAGKLGYAPQPSAQLVGETRTPEQARPVFDQLAGITRHAGFNVNLAPVVDLRGPGPNPGVGAAKRTYGGDPERVVEFGAAFVASQRRHGILPVLKHFPGHGSSPVDSHAGLVDITAAWQPRELEPFARLIASDHAPAILTGHLLHRELASDGHPVSLSRAAIQELLRGRLKHRGLVISDDLQMVAIRRHYSLEQAIILAINAGSDLLMISNSHQPDPDLPGKLVALIVAAVRDGRIQESTLRASWARQETAWQHLMLDPVTSAGGLEHPPGDGHPSVVESAAGTGREPRRRRRHRP